MTSIYLPRSASIADYSVASRLKGPTTVTIKVTITDPHDLGWLLAGLGMAMQAAPYRPLPKSRVERDLARRLRGQAVPLPTTDQRDGG
jgi:hypothetical protein